MIGQTVAHYRILEKIGAGGMGEVFLAEDTKLDRKVALKFLPAQFSADKDERKRFIHEAKAAAALNHPNIITVYETGEHEGQVFIAMEYVEGRTLKDIVSVGTGRVPARGQALSLHDAVPSPITHHPLPIDQVIDIATQIASGLAAAHVKGIVHRDLKPANVMLTDEGSVKIVDFGLAKLKGLTRLTKSGTTLGTVAYMSPEQAQGKEVDHRTDIWSLGVILYEMLTGKLPFPGEYDQAMLYAVINEEPESISKIRSDIPDELRIIVGKALAKKKEERYQHADELLTDLRHENKSLEYAKAGKVMQDKAAPKPGRRTLFLAAAAVVVLAIFFFLFSPFKLRIGQRQSVQAAVNSLAIMYFENMQDPTDKSKLAQMITALLTTGLSDSPRYIQVVSSQRLFDILNLLGKGDLRVIDKSVATEVAKKAGVQWMVTGKILKEEPNIALISEISDAATGKILATQRVNGAVGEDLFAVVDKLSPQVVRALTLPEQAIKGLEKPVAALTTHSQDAYRSYIEGVDALDKKDYPEAVKHFKKTLEYDPTFAMAYYCLARVKSEEGADLEANEYIAQAQKYSAKLTQKEKLYIKSQVDLIAGNYEQSVKTLQEIVAQYPEEKDAYYVMGRTFDQNLSKPAESIRCMKKAIALDPFFKRAYNVLAYAYDQTGDFEKSLWAINQYIALAPGEANPYDSRGELYAWNGQIDQAIASYKKALEIKPDFYGSLFRLGSMYFFKKEYAKAENPFKELTSSNDQISRVNGRSGLALIPMYQGKLKEALRVLEDGIAADKLENKYTYNLAFKHSCKAKVQEERGNLGLAIQEIKAGWGIFKKIRPKAPLPWRYYYVHLLARNGKMAEAEGIVQELKKKSEENQESADLYWQAAGTLALEKGDLKNARNYFEKINYIYFQGKYLLASTYLQLGILDKAAAILEKALSRYSNDRIGEPILAVKAYYLLGLVYEKSGWKDKAIENFKEFLDIWKNADPGLPEVVDARQRLEKLKKL
jgi:tetratricopeptide (TPR) repeat protein